KELRSKITIPLAQSSRPIQINSDYLRVNFKPEQPGDESEVQALKTVEDLTWLNTLPAIEFECDDCKIASYQLDKVSASLYGDGQKLSIS
ncbi:hypothetical protein, partial [Streptomyces brasiliscabiei]|uniref:hypothetical protein n=1 Tax=Streptomyces brasiliscabiei TaxID=2736302 RepID=UPI0030153F2D